MIEMEERRLEKMQRRQVQTCVLASIFSEHAPRRRFPPCVAFEKNKLPLNFDHIWLPAVTEEVRAKERIQNIEVFDDLAWEPSVSNPRPGDSRNIFRVQDEYTPEELRSMRSLEVRYLKTGLVVHRQANLHRHAGIALNHTMPTQEKELEQLLQWESKQKRVQVHNL